VKTKQITPDKKEFLKGIDKVYRAVRTTFGPRGRIVSLITQFNELVYTKDGVTVARNIFLPGIQGMGADTIKEPALALNVEVGDGTTSAVILTKHLIDEGYKGGITDEEVDKSVDKYKEPFTPDRVKDIAMIASNGDREISEKIQELYKEYDGNVHVILEEGYLEDVIEKRKGWFAETGFISPYSVNNYKKFAITYPSKYDIFIYPDKLANPDHLIKALSASQKRHKALVIVVDDISAELLERLAQLYDEKKMWTAVIKAPGFGKQAMELAKDLATVTGGQVYTKNSVFNVPLLGEGDKFYADSNKAIISVDTKNEKIEELVKELKEKLGEAVTKYDRQRLRERIQNILGGVAVVYVGGHTAKDRKERYYRWEDAVAAVSASKEGIVRGAGVTYEKVAKDIGKPELKKAVEKMLKDLNVEPVEVWEPAKLVKKVLKTALRIAGVVNNTEMIVWNENEKA